MRRGGPASDDPLRGIRERHPKLRVALVADAKMAARYRGEPSEPKGRQQTLALVLRLMWSSDAFFALACYRAKARAQARGLPLLPAVFHRLAMITAQVCIGTPVVIEPGIYLAHGQVVIDGLVEIGTGTAIFPWVTIGLRAGDWKGPRIGNGVQIGTGAKIIGPIHVGNNAQIGANAVVVADVAARSTVVGIPARAVGDRDSD